MAVKIKIKKNDFDEFEVQWIENGVKNEAKTCYTDDYDDAILTRDAIKRDLLAECHKCGNKGPDNRKFYCPNCGCKLP